jgi:hypothetical protein
MKITDFGKKTNVPQNKLKIQESVTTPASKVEMIEEDVPPIFGVTEEQMATVGRIRRTCPEAYNRMINWD